MLGDLRARWGIDEGALGWMTSSVHFGFIVGTLFFAGLAGHPETDVWRSATSGGSKPCAGIWGLEGIKAGSISSDSFNSTVGPYDATTAGNQGNLCSARGITVEGSFEVDGDVMTGFGYPLVVNGSSGQITGLTTSRITDVEAPSFDFGDVSVKIPGHLNKPGDKGAVVMSITRNRYVGKRR